jgi:hypothetical protein
MSNTSSSSGGVGFLGMLTILFVGLKLADVIDWSWWWVLSPMWIGVATLVVIGGVVVVVSVLTDKPSRR